MSFDLYQTITDQIVFMLETGTVPWRSPILGRTSAGHPKNLDSDKKYRGVNVFLLAFTAYARGFDSSLLGDFQLGEAGGRQREERRDIVDRRFLEAA